MSKVIDVRFRPQGKVYYFDPGIFEIQKGDFVVVQTARGDECGEVTQGAHEVPQQSLAKALRPVLRIADGPDIRRMQKNREDEQRAFKECEERIRKHNLDMKLVDVEYTMDRSKILFYFTADGRIDFRDLVKDLAGVFHTRIELRQIGVRDESKLLGGLGICGQPFCCNRFLSDFQPVSIKMAKEQGLSLNPAKISGSCGRLMCCLAYEEDAYEYLNSLTPPQGSVVETPEGEGYVAEVNVLSGNVKVRLDKNPDAPPKLFKREECVYLRGGKRTKNSPKPREAAPVAAPAPQKPRKQKG